MNLREITSEVTQPTSPQTIENKQKKKPQKVLTCLSPSAYTLPVKQSQLTPKQVVRLLKSKQGKLSKRQFAFSLGISPSHLGDIYDGSRRPGPKVLSKLGLVTVKQPITYEVA